MSFPRSCVIALEPSLGPTWLLHLVPPCKLEAMTALTGGRSAVGDVLGRTGRLSSTYWHAF